MDVHPVAPSQVPESEIALLANILTLTTHNMATLSAMLSQLGIELASSTDTRLQQAGQKALADIEHLSHSLETQMDLIGALARFCPLLKRATPLVKQPLVTQIHITELPRPR
ncbi:MAG: hypothetical protein GAK43_02759 [Stenotrophomonas maltophilia]|nr:MAG: hypothetical protein GAK43_02759 [Stenotrophomonas maltophilia]